MCPPGGARKPSRPTAALCLCALLIACDLSERGPAASQEPQTPKEASPTGTPDKVTADAPQPLTRGQVIEVPAGSVRLGSEPGALGRDAAHEADGVEVTVPAFAMDRLPFPNDPSMPPTTGVARGQAAKTCAEVGKRLCSEVEWERACKGDAAQRFSTGAELDVNACARTPERCPSPVGVASLGAGLAEWTADTVSYDTLPVGATAVVRGGAMDGTAAPCSARLFVSPDKQHPQLGFRCCRGAGDPAPYPVEPKRPLIAPLDKDNEALRGALGAVKALAPFAKDFTRYERTDIDEALRRGKRRRGNITAWHIAPSVFRWSPVRGEEYWVLSGRTGGKGLLALLYPQPGGFGLAASTVFDERNPVLAIGYTDDKPTQLLFTTCFGCPGESGDIHYRDGSLAVSYR